jgi:hypothetical protein
MASAVALTVYAPLLVAAVVLVWRRPVVALYLFIVGLALHNLVLSLLYDAGVDGFALDAVQAWKETLLAAALARIGVDAGRARQLPFRPRAIDVLALAFGTVAFMYAVLPQNVLDGEAGRTAILYGLRHALLPVAAYFVGRSVALTETDLRRVGWTIVGAAAAVAAIGLVDEYAVPVEWWRDSGAVGFFQDELGYEQHGPGGLPENFAFNSDEGLFRRLVSVFVSPLGAAFMFVVALLLAVVPGPLRRRPQLLAPLVAVIGVGLLFTLTRSALVALAGGLVVLALARRHWWPVAAAAATLVAGLAFALTFESFAPKTHFFPEDLPYQQAQAKKKGELPENAFLNPSEPSFRSHLTNLRDGLETVAEHPQGYGLGNAGSTARRFGEPVRAGESTYTELGVELGLLGMLLFVAWNIALLVTLLRGDGWAVGVGAALAAVLALAIQTDVIGAPWLAYCLWWLAGGTVERRWESRSIRARTSVMST